MHAVFILQCLVFVVLSLGAEIKNTQIKGEHSIEEQQHPIERYKKESITSQDTKKRIKREKLKGFQSNMKTKTRKNLRKKQKNTNLKENSKREYKNNNRKKQIQKARRRNQSRFLSGESCDWLDFDTVRSKGSNCVDGTKMVIKNKKGVRKQFLVTNGKTIYAFVTNGEKFASCSDLVEVTDSVSCKTVPGLSSLSLSGSGRASRVREQGAEGRKYVGRMCEWIDIGKVKNSCKDGSKFVISGEKGTRKQFLFVDGKEIIAFVKNKEKFVNCSVFTEVTEMVTCKPVPGVGEISLLSPASGFSEEEDFDLSDDNRIIDPVLASDNHQVTVTAKFWYVSDFDGDAETLADTYALEMNAALARSNVPITYRRWGRVQMLPVTHADIETEGSSHTDRLRNFLNSHGDSEEGRQTLKQSADHMVVMVNPVQGPYSCVIFSPWGGNDYTDTYATFSVSYDMTGVFVHEAGHCLGAMHDRFTMNEPHDPAYNYGYCLPDSPYATAMTYTRSCPAPRRHRILHFSNPAVTFEGIPTGDERNNNARAITESRDRTSKYGSNCYDGNPDEEGNMENMCRFTSWSSWTEWTECCCVARQDLRTCPTAPYEGEDCQGCISYLWKQQARSKTRDCLNALNETTHGSSCSENDPNGAAVYERRRCDCSVIQPPITTTTTPEPVVTTTTTTTTQPTTSAPNISAKNFIESPNYPASYGNHEDDEKVVTVAEGKVILFQWEDFEIESHSSCVYDSVTVVEFIQGVEQVLIPKSCGSFPPFPSFRSTTHQVGIRFLSDGSVTRRGFRLSWEEVEPEAGVAKRISSPGYPENYENNLDIEQRIEVTQAKKILMVFKLMSIESHETCNYDYVKITDDDGTVLLPKTCGKLNKVLEVTSSTNQVTITLHTDRSVTATGFLIEWKEI